MAQTFDSDRQAPPDENLQTDRGADASDAPADDQDDDVWAPSSWDLRQGLDVAELAELPAEWPDLKPR